MNVFSFISLIANEIFPMILETTSLTTSASFSTLFSLLQLSIARQVLTTTIDVWAFICTRRWLSIIRRCFSRNCERKIECSILRLRSITGVKSGDKCTLPLLQLYQFPISFLDQVAIFVFVMTIGNRGRKWESFLPIFSSLILTFYFSRPIMSFIKLSEEITFSREPV